MVTNDLFLDDDYFDDEIIIDSELEKNEETKAGENALESKNEEVVDEKKPEEGDDKKGDESGTPNGDEVEVEKGLFDEVVSASSSELEEEKITEDISAVDFGMEFGFEKEELEGVKSFKDLLDKLKTENEYFKSQANIQKPDLAEFNRVLSTDINNSDSVLELAKEQLESSGVKNPDKLLASMEDEDIKSLAQQRLSWASASKGKAEKDYNEKLTEAKKVEEAKIKEASDRILKVETEFKEVFTKEKYYGTSIPEKVIDLINAEFRNPIQSKIVEGFFDPKVRLEAWIALSPHPIADKFRKARDLAITKKAVSNFVKNNVEDKIDVKVDTGTEATKKQEVTRNSVTNADDDDSIEF